MCVYNRPKIKVLAARRYSYSNSLIHKYINDHPMYQDNESGIRIPVTPWLITVYFHWRRKNGPEDVKARFKAITDSLIVKEVKEY